MADNHRIIDLLTRGVVPTEAESKDLAGVGTFASALHGRYLGGMRLTRGEQAGARTVRWARRIAASLSARTAERWSAGMGLASSLFDGGWSGTWQTRGGGRAGYEAFEPDMTAIVLEDDEPLQADGLGEPTRRRRRSSLFGPRAARRRAARMAGARKQPRSQPARWLGGGEVSPEAVQALESGGLYLDDQLALADGSVEDPRPAGARAPRRRISLDGLEVGAATPALASALAWAEGAFGEEAGVAPLAVTATSTAGLLNHEPAWQRMGSDDAQRAVFAFFDSVEGDFVSLTPERVTQAAAAFEAPVPSRRPLAVDGPATAPVPRATRGPVSASLSAIVPPGASRTTPRVQPFTQGVFPSGHGTPPAQRRAPQRAMPAASPRFAATVARDAGGRPVAGVQRSAMSAPRVSIVTAATHAEQAAQQPMAGSHTRWHAAADMGPDLPLGATLTRHESMSGTLSARRASTLAGGRVEAFSPVIASDSRVGQALGGDGRHPQGPMGATAFADRALDGVVWLSLPADEADLQAPHELTPMSVVPTGRVASMVPADAVVTGAIGARELLTRGVGGSMASTPVPPQPALATELAAGAGVYGTEPVPTASTLARSGVMLTPRRISNGILTGLSPSDSVEPGVAAAIASSTQGAGDSPLAEAVSARWMAGDGSEDAVEAWSPRAAMTVTTGLGRGVYAAGRSGLDVTMVEQAGGEPEAGVQPSVGRRRVTRVIDGPPPPRVTVTPAMSERTEARIAAQEALGRPVSDELQTPPALFDAPGGLMRSPEHGGVVEARSARAALRRPVMTAREVMELSSFAGPQGPASVARMPALGGGLGSSVEPSLVRYLSAAREAGQLALSGAAIQPPAAPFLAQLASLTPAEARRADGLLRRAGWSETERHMLRLGADGLGESEPGSAADSDRTSDIVGSGGPPARPGAGVSEAAAPTARQMTRNLARILTGTEALMAGTSEPGAPRTVAPSVESMLGGAGAFVAPTATERYFHTNAPARGRARWTSELRDAVGELVAMAEEASGAEGPVSGAAWEQVAGRVRAVRATLSGRARRDAPPLGDGVAERTEAMVVEPVRTGVAPSGLPLLDEDELLKPGAAAFETPATGAPVMPGYRDLADTDLGMLRLDEQSTVEGDAAQRPGGLSERIDQALATSASGPAGVERLTRSLTTRAGVQPQASSEGGRPQSALVAGAVPLSSAMAPEAMLSGMRSEAFGRHFGVARPAMGRRADPGRGETPGELAGLLGSPAEPGVSSVGRQQGQERSGQKAATQRIMSTLRRAGVSEESVNTGLLHGLVKRLQQTATGGSLRRGQLADFTMAWLERVDGGRTGVDLGLGDLQAEVSDLVGAWTSGRRTSRLASQSPIDEAKTVVMPEQSGAVADRSGLRRAARQGLSGGSRASRPRHRAAAAVQQADWKFVDTGSGASTPHADLGQLAAKIMETSAVAGQAPMPLVAPAVKAVAQTALRKGREESMGGGAASSDGGAPSGTDGASSDAPTDAGKMGKAAFEKLAYEMADRIAKRLKREQERRGHWP